MAGATTSSSSSSPSSAGEGPEQMEMMELDAARTLADLRGNSQGSKVSISAHACSRDAYIRGNQRFSGNTMDRSCATVLQNSATANSSGCSANPVLFFNHLAKDKSSEAKKEDRRIRRILANRESARQTIRRRQAIRDELANKVAQLSIENESMKMEKEMAMEEYLSLIDKNKRLKEQMAIRCNVAGEQITDCTEAGPSSSLSRFPLAAHSRPPSTFPWPVVNHLFHEGDNPTTVGGPMPFFCVQPCAWFYPLIHYMLPYSHLSRYGTETTMVGQQGVSCSSDAIHAIDPKPWCHGSNTDVSLSTTVAARKHKNVITGSSTRETEMSGSCSQYEHSDLKGEQAIDVRDELSAGNLNQILPNDQHQQQCAYPWNKVMEAEAAADARRKRKELTELKRRIQGKRDPSQD